MLLSLLSALACHPPLDLNSPPGVRFVSPADTNTLNEGQPVTIAVEVWDADSSALHVEVISNIQGFLKDESLDLSQGQRNLTFTVPELAGGDHTLTATVRDDTSDQSAQVAIHVNFAPTAPTVVITPQNPTTSDEILATVSTDSTDLDSPTVFYHSWWEDEGGAQVPGTRVGGSHTQKGQTWTFFALVASGDAFGNRVDGGAQRVTEYPITIVNALPTPPIPEITPAQPLPSQSLHCDIVTPSADADPDPLTYRFRWAQNDVEVPEVTAAVLPATYTDLGERWTCYASAWDGEGQSGEGRADVEIAEPTVYARGLAARLTDEIAGTALGTWVVGTAADNSDALSDLVLGVPVIPGDFGRGQVAVVLGSTLESFQDWADAPGPFVEGAQAAQFGRNLTLVGNILGNDGLSDVAATDNDSVYLLRSRGFSTATVSTLNAAFPGVVLASPPGEEVGVGMVSADLCDGDLYPELFFADTLADRREVRGFSSGRLRAATPSTLPATVNGAVHDWKIAGPAEDFSFGRVLAAGSASGSSCQDLLVVSPGQNTFGYLFFAQALRNGEVGSYADAAITFTNDLASAELGSSAILVGSLDSDAFAEVLFGSPDDDAVLLFPGNSLISGDLLASSAPLQLEGDEAGSRFGARVLEVGDLDGDSIPEVAVAAPDASSVENVGDGAGKVFVFSGADLQTRVLIGSGTLYASAALLTFVGEPGDHLGVSGPVGDLDGDGLADLALTAPSAASGSGIIYVWKSAP